ncbi:methyltransferase domain-containing protein [Paraflavitalea speifideaquila]|uniref:methyltransferase domain-containing protein n=1 Tax=Paraflavitalea speifideaquila TaxID=3076558 RepID=UPI0028EE8AC5|nr:methyltransferase domain-containing protein [Paraflavitalea speifideiaquila]
MLIKKFDPRNSASINQYFRRKRFKFFSDLIERVPKPLQILDIGGHQSYWEQMGFINNKDIHITLLNLEAEPVVLPGFSSVVGDATDLKEFKDKSFDIVFSNSVIEHLFTLENQKRWQMRYSG